MEGSFLRFYVREGDRHQGRPVWEWLLERANQLGVRGGSAFRAMAGFGRHHLLHEAKFFELAGSLAVEVEFIVTEEEARALLTAVQSQNLRLFYARTPASFGMTAPDAADTASPAT